MHINSLRHRSPLAAKSPSPAPVAPCRVDEFRAQEAGHDWFRLIPARMLLAVGTLGATQAALAQDATSKLLAGVEDMRSGRVPTPTYLGGAHPDWEDDNDHCYSIYFRIAIGQGLLSKSEAEDLMARMHGPAPNAFVDNLFPHGAEVLALRGSQVLAGVIPAGQLISMDGSDHVMMSTGRLTEAGEHEVYSFKGGGPETPVWGDSLGYHVGAKIHKTTVESELRALEQDDQPIDKVVLVTGRSALQR